MSDIFDKIEALARSIPDEELARLPTDGASNHDHYLYGAPKRADAMTDTHEKFIDRVRAYAEKATKGPWGWILHENLKRPFVLQASCDVPGNRHHGLGHKPEECGDLILCTDFDDDNYLPEVEEHGDFMPNETDAAFIAQARTDLPAALSIIEQLVAEKECAQVMIRDGLKSVQQLMQENGTLVRERDEARARVAELQEELAHKPVEKFRCKHPEDLVCPLCVWRQR